MAFLGISGFGDFLCLVTCTLQSQMTSTLSISSPTALLVKTLIGKQSADKKHTLIYTSCVC